MDWETYFRAMASLAAQKSKDSTQVGAILVSEEGSIILTAFNGPPKGVEDLPERRERPAKYLFAAHAEQNLIAFAARAGIRTKRCLVYSTCHPCASCAKTLIQAGIAAVISGDNVTSMASEEFEAARIMFDEAGVVFLRRETAVAVGVST